MIPALFPDGVITFDATGEAAWEGPDARLHPREEALIARAGPKRRREFTLGRHCARRALRELGIEDFPLLADAERMPIWPAGIVGSLSHGGGLTAVAVARRGHILGIGLDVEEAGSLDEQVIERICGKAELKSLEELARSAPDSWARLVFSAKESVYKCYYPLTRRKLWFRDVEMRADPEHRTFTVRLLRGAEHIRGLDLSGRFSHDGTHVFTGVTLTAEGAVIGPARRSPSR